MQSFRRLYRGTPEHLWAEVRVWETREGMRWTIKVFAPDRRKLQIKTVQKFREVGSASGCVSVNGLLPLRHIAGWGDLLTTVESLADSIRSERKRRTDNAAVAASN